MAWSFVNVTELRGTSGTSFNGSVTATAGNALICCAGAFIASGSATPTTSGGGTWTKDTSGVFAASAFGGSISSCPNATGGTQTITVTTTSGSGGGLAFVYEFSGNPTSSMQDAASPAVATGTGTTATSGSLTNSNANALYVGFMMDNDGGNPTTITGTTSGVTYPAGGKETNASTYDAIGTGYEIVSSVAARTMAWTITSSSWISLIAAYKPAAGGGGGSVQQQLTLLGVGSRTLRTPRPEVYRSRRARRHAAITQPFGVDRLISIPNTIRGKSLINV